MIKLSALFSASCDFDLNGTCRNTNAARYITCLRSNGFPHSGSPSPCLVITVATKTAGSLHRGAGGPRRGHGFSVHELASLNVLDLVLPGRTTSQCRSLAVVDFMVPISLQDPKGLVLPAHVLDQVSAQESRPPGGSFLIRTVRSWVHQF